MVENQRFRPNFSDSARNGSKITLIFIAILPVYYRTLRALTHSGYFSVRPRPSPPGPGSGPARCPHHRGSARRRARATERPRCVAAGRVSVEMEPYRPERTRARDSQEPPLSEAETGSVAAAMPPRVGAVHVRIDCTDFARSRLSQ